MNPYDDRRWAYKIEIELIDIREDQLEDKLIEAIHNKDFEVVYEEEYKYEPEYGANGKES